MRLPCCCHNLYIKTFYIFLQIYIFPLKTQKKSLKNLHKREILLIFAADLKHKKKAIITTSRPTP